MKETLLAFTTANQLDYTKLCINSLKNQNVSSLEVLVVDDASNDGTPEYCKDQSINCITKSKPYGLTHSWNLAYEQFINGNYKYLILSNNDILFPYNSLKIFIESMHIGIMHGPLSNPKGVELYPKQMVSNYITDNISADNPESYESIQNILNRTYIKNSYLHESDYLSGFLFGFNRRIRDFEWRKGVLFNPDNRNVGNEDELCDRIEHGKLVNSKVFVFHFKGVSFKDYQLIDGSLLNRELLWTKANSMKSNKFEKFIYSVKYRLSEFFKR